MIAYFDSALKYPEGIKDHSIISSVKHNQSMVAERRHDDLNISLRSRASGKSSNKKSRKINIDEFGYSNDHLKKARDSFSQISRGSSARKNK